MIDFALKYTNISVQQEFFIKTGTNLIKYFVYRDMYVQTRSEEVK